MRTNLDLSLLDYRFGWRWLLPVAVSDKVTSVGLNADEQEWWAQKSSFTLASNEGEVTDGWLVALGSVDLDSVGNYIYGAEPNWLCAWGSGAKVAQFRSNLRGFSLIREYALLPEANSRVVVPLSSPHFTVTGLRLHRPGRWIARLGLMVARSLARFGYYGLLRRRVLLIAMRDINALPQGLVQSGLSSVTAPASQSDYALYLGTPDENRKTVVLPLSDTPSSQILKVAELPKACSALQNESQALIVMSQTSLAECVPKLIELKKTKEQVTLVQEYRARRSVAKSRMDAAVIDFLVNLSQIECKQVALVTWLSTLPDYLDVELSAEARGSALKLRTHLGGLAKDGTNIWLHRCHGDFAPWNCSWSDKGLFVFDWEESTGESLALGDAFYFVLSPFIHVKDKVGANKALEVVLNFVSKVVVKQDFYPGNVKLYLAIWLLNRLSQGTIYAELVVRLEKEWQ